MSEYCKLCKVKVSRLDKHELTKKHLDAMPTPLGVELLANVLSTASLSRQELTVMYDNRDHLLGAMELLKERGYL